MLWPWFLEIRSFASSSAHVVQASSEGCLIAELLLVFGDACVARPTGTVRVFCKHSPFRRCFYRRLTVRQRRAGLQKVFEPRARGFRRREDADERYVTSMRSFVETKPGVPNGRFSRMNMCEEAKAFRRIGRAGESDPMRVSSGWGQSSSKMLARQGR